jgi:hypothetical protein
MVNDLRRFRNWTENPRVGGSIPPLATSKTKSYATFLLFSRLHQNAVQNDRRLQNHKLADAHDMRTKNPLVGPDVLADLFVFKELAFLCRGNPVVAQYLCHEFPNSSSLLL